jgi:hypothetical protein
MVFQLFDQLYGLVETLRAQPIHCIKVPTVQPDKFLVSFLQPFAPFSSILPYSITDPGQIRVAEQHQIKAGLPDLFIQPKMEPFEKLPRTKPA